MFSRVYRLFVTVASRSQPADVDQAWRAVDAAEDRGSLEVSSSSLAPRLPILTLWRFSLQPDLSLSERFDPLLSAEDLRVFAPGTDSRKRWAPVTCRSHGNLTASPPARL